MVLPQLAADLWFDVRGAAVAEALRALFDSRAGTKVAVWELIGPAVAFATPYFAVTVALFIISVSAYFALVELAVQQLRNQPVPAATAALKRGLSLALKRLPGLFLVMILLGLFGQVMTAPVIVASVLGLVLPVIIVAEGKGAIRSAIDAVTMRYARASAYGVWGVAFNLLSLGASFYFGFMLVALGIEQFLILDQRLPALRPLWSIRFGSLPLGPVYLFATIAETALLMGILAFVPAVTASLYFTVVGRREIARV